MTNPYESPQSIEPDDEARGWPTHWYYTYVGPIATASFWFGIVISVLGLIISFAPGGASDWYAISSIFFAIGIGSTQKWVRLFAAMAMVVCIVVSNIGL